MKKRTVVVLAAACILFLTWRLSFYFPRETPEDFSFSLTWGVWSISTCSYDSKTGKLTMKTTDALSPGDYAAFLEFSEEEKHLIYNIIRRLRPDTYPAVYDPQHGGMLSDPFMALILSVQANGKENSISAASIALSWQSDNIRGQRFLTACHEIVTILTETDEWKSFPDHDHHYA